MASTGSSSGEVQSSNSIPTEDHAYNQKWYFEDIGREKSEEILLKPELETGTFLLRKSQNARNPFALSVLDRKSRNSTIKHYRIHCTHGNYWIRTSKKFNSLFRLVKHYQKNDGLCCHLRENHSLKDKKVSDIWEIKRSTLQYYSKLGEGYFAEVYQGVWNRKDEVAIKQLKPYNMSPEAFLEEAEIMKQLQHENIIILYGVVLSDPVNIVMEYMSHGNLIHYMRHAGRTLTAVDQLYIAKQIASGMAFVELHQYVHRDLRAANILVAEDMVCKISDFGLARPLLEGIYNAYGNRLRHKEVRYKVMSGYRMSKPRGNCTEDLYGFMLTCWKEDPSRRPAFKTLKEMLESSYERA